MEPTRTDRILDEWSQVASSATPPGAPPRSVAVTRAGPGVSLVGAGLLVVAVVAAVAWLGGRDSQSSVGDTTSPSPTSPVSSPASTAPVAEGSASPTVEPSPTATVSPCQRLETQLTWEGAAGQRIATITVSNRFDGTCDLGTITRVQYVDGLGNVVIDGPVPPGADQLAIGPQSQVRTMVEVGNYCGPALPQPVSIRFVFSSGGFLAVESPESEADMSVPPCNGPGAPATIQMQPWEPVGP